MLNAQVIGNLGADAVIKEFNGKKFVSMSVAHTENYKDSQGQKQSNTVWVSVSWSGEGYGILPFLKKGTKVYATGRQSVKMYNDRNNQAQISINIEAADVVLCSGRKEGE